MGFFNKLFGGADGIRETMRESYDKHRQVHAGLESFTPHERGLYGALASRYRAAHEPRPEIQIWTELIPFLLMDEADAVEAMAEIVVHDEAPIEARALWLGDQIRRAIRERLPTATDFHRNGAARALGQGHRPWLSFLTQAEREVILSSVAVREGRVRPPTHGASADELMGPAPADTEGRSLQGLLDDRAEGR